jgi:uncharacterized protein (DUF983 family)
MTSDFPAATVATRDTARSIMRGWGGKCPNCGEGRMFKAFLNVADACPACGEALHHHRADDAPPYLTIFVVGHVLVAGVLAVERSYQPDFWVHAVLWTPLTIAMSLWLLPRFKGALVGLQWALRMHGFDEGRAEDPAASSGT